MRTEDHPLDYADFEGAIPEHRDKFGSSRTLYQSPFIGLAGSTRRNTTGYRILAYKEGAKVMLRSRNDHDRTATFAGVARAVGQLQDRSVLLDGEVVAFDSKGVSRFQLLQRGDVAQSFAVFDCLYRNGRDLRSEPLLHRQRELEAAIEDPEQLFLARRLAQKMALPLCGAARRQKAK